jgi:sugar phosphate isomerase/epimerase
LAELSGSGIKVWAVHGIMGMNSISPDPAARAAAVEDAYVHAAKRAMFAPCPLVEHYLYRHNDPEIGKRYRESVWNLYEKVSKLGYILCIETAPYKPLQYERHPDSAEIAEFVRSFGKDDLQVIVDFNHSNLAEDLGDTARNTRGLVKSVHISNNYGQKEEHRPPQDGIIDLKYAWDAFRANGYTGPCNLEFRFPNGGVDPDTAMLKEVRAYMEKLLWNK